MSKNLKLLKNRISAKRFVKNFEIKNEDKIEILESIRFAPSSFGIEPYRVLWIENKEIKNEILPNWWNQVGVTQSSAILIWVTYKEDYLVKTHRPKMLKQNIPDEFENVREGMIQGSETILSTLKMTRDEWTARQVYISLGTVLSTCEELGYDTCPSEGFDSQGVADVLNKFNLIDIENEKVVVGMFLGKVDVNQEFHHSFEKKRRQPDEVYKIIK